MPFSPSYFLENYAEALCVANSCQTEKKKEVIVIVCLPLSLPSSA